MIIPQATILVVNIVSIIFLIGLTVLLFLTRKHIRTGIAMAVIILLTTLPIYMYNICFLRGWFKEALVIAPFAYSSGTAFFPALWIFVHRYFNSSIKFSKIRLVHFIPTVVCLAIYSIYIIMFSFPERVNFILFKNTYMSDWIEAINITVIAVQAVIYISIIFIYIGKVKKFIGESFAETQWADCLWISKTIFLLIIAFTVLLIGHHFWESSGTWLLNILDIIIMSYFTYHVVEISHRDISAGETACEEIQFDAQIEYGIAPSLQESSEYANIINEYLTASKIYLNPELTIKDVSNTIGISINDISHSLRTVCQCTFFDFVNRLRIERAVRTLNNDKLKEQNLTTITYQSGFISKAAFHSAFKKIVGKTPKQFIEEMGQQE